MRNLARTRAIRYALAFRALLGVFNLVAHRTRAHVALTTAAGADASAAAAAA